MNLARIKLGKIFNSSKFGSRSQCVGAGKWLHQDDKETLQ